MNRQDKSVCPFHAEPVEIPADQVAGFGSSIKRGIGRSVMAKQLSDIFQRSRLSFQPSQAPAAPLSVDPGLLR